jgi:catechol 2,3-dioxygenase-like lactoylglutathione lyase family enzyme
VRTGAQQAIGSSTAILEAAIDSVYRNIFKCIDIRRSIRYGHCIDKRQCVVDINSQEEIMSRVQLALNVADLDASIEFYTKLFQTEPAKIRDGYANFAIADPPLKLILFTGMGEPGSLNHIGVEVEDVDAVQAMIARANDLGLDQKIREDVSCCFAVQDKTWVKGPENDWEFYTVLGPGSDAYHANHFHLDLLRTNARNGRHYCQPSPYGGVPIVQLPDSDSVGAVAKTPLSFTGSGGEAY